jgi:general secretion pathway protein K
MNRRAATRGGALLAVLWLSAALGAIAFAVATTVRGEITRSEGGVEGLKAHYLAAGAAERGLTYMLWGGGPRLPDGRPRYWDQGVSLMRFAFPGGEAVVEIIPESSKFNVNLVPPEDLMRLIAALGIAPGHAQQLAAAIVDWRAPSPAGPISPFDEIYLRRTPSFRSPHASFEQIEELLSVHGMTPEIYYGRFDRAPDGTLAMRSGLKDCLSVYSSHLPFDLNTVEPAVMLAVGVPPAAVNTILTMRRLAPLRPEQLPMINELLGPASGRFRIGGDRIFTLRATARPRRPDGRLSDTRRTVAMTVQFASRMAPEGYRVLDWQENASVRNLSEFWPQ